MIKKILNQLIRRRNRESMHINAYTGTAYSNRAANLDDELNRRFTQYTPEPSAKPDPKSIKSNKDSLKSEK